MKGRYIRKKMILDLRNEGKTFREIAKETQTSFRDIGTVLDEAKRDAKANTLQMQRKACCSEAFELFREGKSQLDVAITLKLKQSEATDYYIQYLRLQGSDDVIEILKAMKGDIWYFVKFYKMVKSAKMDIEDVKNILSIANHHLPSIESKYQRV
ncbi:MAG TPA: hypothetical protein VE130_14715, partial [Nitrososphaeraceae archaeon]|nr:hypothetical protein [Nitrososphaeraceae archaeon]